MESGLPAQPSGSLGVSATRSPRRSSPSTQSMPLGTAVYDADVQHRAERVAMELIDAFPEVESHEERLQTIIARALDEQDRASRADEVLRRFSPSVQQYVKRHSSVSM